MKAQRIAKSQKARIRRKKLKVILEEKTERLYAKMRRARRSRSCKQ
jgi:hypothetical protein